MAEDELLAFREHWKQELGNASKKEERQFLSARAHPGDFRGQPGHGDQEHRYFKDLCQDRNSTEQRDESSPSTPERSSSIQDTECDGGGKGEGKPEDQPEYVSIARSLLDGRTSPLLDRIQEERTRRKRQYHNMTNVCSLSLQQQTQRKAKKGEKLVDQLIQDLV